MLKQLYHQRRTATLRIIIIVTAVKNLDYIYLIVVIHQETLFIYVEKAELYKETYNKIQAIKIEFIVLDCRPDNFFPQPEALEQIIPQVAKEILVGVVANVKVFSVTGLTQLRVLGLPAFAFQLFRCVKTIEIN